MIQTLQSPMRRSLRTALAASTCAAALAVTAPAALAQAGDGAASSAASAVPSDGPTFVVGPVGLRYVVDNPQQPPIEALENAPLTLAVLDSGLAAPRPGARAVVTSIADLAAADPRPWHASAIQAVSEQLRDALVERDLLGTFVIQDPTQISPAVQDLRAEGATELDFLVTTAVVTELRTVAFGDRVRERGDIEPGQAENHPLHQDIRRGSPVQPSADGDPANGDVLRRGELDRYLFFKSRHPGRQVSAAISAAQVPGTAALDLNVTENRPLSLYAQISNTGTSTSDYLRQRFGLLHTQLTNSDDILSVEYLTANFDDVNAFIGSYERPLWSERIRGSISGSWSEYLSEDVGIFNEDFSGETWAMDARVAWNFFQDRELFLDFIGGVRFESISTDRTGFIVQDGQGDFLTPYVGLSLDRTTEWFATRGTLLLEYQGDFMDNDLADLNGLGRTSPDDSWARLRYDLRHSFYLEPVLDRAAWEDPTTPDSSRLAHEMRLALRGQYAFDKRLVPQAQYVAGGLETVRGYPQSFSAADDAMIATVEYRFHVPSALDVEPTPRELFGEPFRFAPQFIYGQPDWDLVLKAFVDAGVTGISEPFSFEGGDTLVGAGIGAELAIKRNFNLRLDWGFALREYEDRGVEQGANRLIFSATLLY